MSTALARLAGVIVALALVASGTAAPSAGAAEPSSLTTVSGTITATDGGAVSDVGVELDFQQPNGGLEHVGWVQTGADGSFAFASVREGNYSLGVYAGDDFANPRPIDFRVGTEAVVKDIRLERAATITGRVTTTDGAAVRDVGVYGYRWDATTAQFLSVNVYANTAADGSYELRKVPSGRLTLWFSTSGTRYLDQYWKNATSLSSAAAFEVTEGELVTGKDVSLLRGATISGSIKTEDGGYFARARMVAERVGSDGTFLSHHWAETGSYGQYVIRRLPPGNYQVSVDATFTNPDYIGDSIRGADGKPVVFTLAEGQSIVVDGLLERNDKSFDSAPAPTISGAATFGGTLKAAAGRWQPAPDSLAYRWLRDGKEVSLTVSATYELGLDDIGHRISVEVIAYRRAYAPTTRRSAETPPVAKASIKAVSEPWVGETSHAGQLLTTSRWLPEDVDLAYQWNRDGKPIPGAKAITYRWTAADIDALLTVTVTASKPGHATVTKTSFPTTVSGKSMGSGHPAISGTAKVGKTLKAKPGKWKPSGVTFSYRWDRNGKPIPGATHASYTLVGADRGKKIRLRVTARAPGYHTTSRFSAWTKKVAAGSLTKGVPRIRGAARVGETLTVEPGAWKPASVTFGFQWYRAGKKVAGATSASYLLTSADKGKRMTVRVRAASAGYTTAYRTSKATSKVTGGA